MYEVGRDVNDGDIKSVGHLVETLVVVYAVTLVVNLRVVMVEKLDHKLEVRLVPGMSSVLVNMSMV